MSVRVSDGVNVVGVEELDENARESEIVVVICLGVWV